jgi:uncharacterized protein YlxW (UPF0749 family)
MITYKKIFILGFLIFIFPFLGFPISFEIFVNSALAIILMFLAVATKLQVNTNSESKPEVFEENKPEEKQEELEEEVEELEEEVEEIEEEVEELKEEVEEVKEGLESAKDLLERLEREQLQNDDKEDE